MSSVNVIASLGSATPVTLELAGPVATLLLATQAANDAQAAESGAAASLAAFKNFWQGAADADPAHRPDSTALVVGDAYFNTDSGILRLYGADGWADYDADAVAAAAAAAAARDQAATSAAAAGTAGSAAVQAAAGFNAVWLGPQTGDPITRPDGSALLGGEAYFNTASKKLRIFDSVSWIDYDATAQSAAAVAVAAAAAAQSALPARGLYTTTAAGVNTGLGAVISGAGAGGANGTYNLVIPAPNPGGTQAVGTATVSGNKITSAALSVVGSNYGATIIIDSAALALLIPGLTGGQITLLQGGGVPFGQPFGLLSGSSTGAIDLYANVNGVATSLGKTIPADVALAALEAKLRAFVTDNAPLPGWAHSFFDSLFNSPGGVREDGVLDFFEGYFNWLTGAGAQFTQLWLDAFTYVSNYVVPGFIWVLSDKDENYTGGFRNDGSIDFQDAYFVRINGVRVAAIINNTQGLHPNLPCAYCLIIFYGQSLSIGVDAAAKVKAALAGALKLDGQNTSINGHDVESYNGLVPLTEPTQIVPTAGNVRESPARGCAQAIGELLSLENTINLGTDSITPIMIAPGEAGAPISGLVKGSAQYDVLIAEVKAVVGYVRQRTGGIVVALSMNWFQGEADYNLIRGGTTTAAIYKTTLAQLQVDAETDICALTGQDPNVFPFRVITYQCDSHLEHGVLEPSIARVQYELAVENPKFSMGAIQYIISHAVGTGQGTLDYGVHDTPNGYDIAGAYQGLRNKRIFIDGKLPNHAFMRYQDFLVMGNVIQIRCEVPTLPLRFETTLITPKPNNGFDLRDPNTLQILNGTIDVSIRQNVITLVCKDTNGQNLDAWGLRLCMGWRGTTPESGYPITGPSLNDRPGLNITDSSHLNYTFDPTDCNWGMFEVLPIYDIVLPAKPAWMT